MPLQAAFTPKELREVLNTAGVSVHIPPAALQLTPFDQKEMEATRMKKRVYDILKKAAQMPADRYCKSFMSGSLQMRCQEDLQQVVKDYVPRISAQSFMHVPPLTGR